jgi:hypothetical protein
VERGKGVPKERDVNREVCEWEVGGLYEHAQPYIRAALMMGVLSRTVCSRVLWGRGGLQCRILGGDMVHFFG